MSVRSRPNARCSSLPIARRSIAWWPNQFRLLLSSFAYVLVETIRRVGLKKTALAQAQVQVQTIRLVLFKIGAAIVRNTRRLRILMSSSYPRQMLFAQVVAQLDSG